MNKQNTTQEQKIVVLEKKLQNIESGIEILTAKKEAIGMEINRRKEELEAFIQNPDTLLEAQKLDFLEEQDWEAEQKNITDKQIKEKVIT